MLGSLHVQRTEAESKGYWRDGWTEVMGEEEKALSLG
jgi:hypothetical protein